MRRECRDRFPRHRDLAIPTCITAPALRTCRDACRDRELAVSFEVGGGENAPGNPQVYVSGKRPLVWDQRQNKPWYIIGGIYWSVGLFVLTGGI